MRYDAIVAGASFAGLAVARELRGNVLLIDKGDIGSFCTSTCTTLCSVVRKVECEDSILSVLKRVRFHAASSCIEYEALDPFCTFDYREFCYGLRNYFNGEFLKANIKGIEGDTVLTDKGDFSAECIVDCTGWRAKLATALEPGFVDEKALFFGLETEMDCEKDDVLQFFWDSRFVDFGYAWKFPAGKKTRFGLGSYRNRKDVKNNLTKFLSFHGQEKDEIYGGFIPFKIRKPVVGRIFLVGDSAGQAWPLTGEGVRQAIYFGRKCGQIIQDIIDKEKDLATGLKEYADFVNKHHCYYSFLFGFQRLFSKTPDWGVGLVAKLFERGQLIHFVQRKYKKGVEL
ncbi:NAD(P)/FAD-dependent oxidoreductase [Candidatus Oleimmundimicrobium sp.]|uniref:NAD(P)/FAD-dependent oxidoreductase n=1 Tax=Candidatus Oleimmundimicrobium sp. TaxID=3060597 RepID=UPI002718B7EE|nr:NAD(P)/FAD-dependent oxidoreductase [Candidatus Oleimmundimicrobium sp.]MDO8886854.1 NAD(P)/FAD-dependent oxidoreductase [Candidatus Oleimmundimicrobium sp.]